MREDEDGALVDLAEVAAARGWPRLRSASMRASSSIGIADQLDHALRCADPNAIDCEHFRAARADAFPVRGDDRALGEQGRRVC